MPETYVKSDLAPKQLTHRLKQKVRVALVPAWRNLFREADIIGVTGSCAKTTTCDLLSEMLGVRAPRVATRGNNALSGIARGFLRQRPWRDRHMVFEVSGHRPGAIAPVVKLIRPTMAIVTVVGSDHRKSFGSTEATAREKAELVAAIPEDGVVVLNADDPLVAAMDACSKARVSRFGRAENADLRLLSAEMDWPKGLRLDLSWRGEHFFVHSSLIGEHWSVAILAALTAALELGVSQETCAEVIARFGAAFNRMSLHELADGRQFVLDSWKAPYWGLPACLEFLKSVTAPRKTVIFGAISDYHGSPKVRYEQAVKWALAVADRVLVVGPEASRVRRLRKSDFADRVMEIYSLNAAAQLLKNDVVDGEVIYIKASRADHLERLFHAQFTDLSCWRDRCGRKSSCIHCRRLLKRRIRTVGGYSRLPWLSREHSKPT